MSTRRVSEDDDRLIFVLGLDVVIPLKEIKSIRAWFDKFIQVHESLLENNSIQDKQLKNWLYQQYAKRHSHKIQNELLKAINAKHLLEDEDSEFSGSDKDPENSSNDELYDTTQSSTHQRRINFEKADNYIKQYTQYRKENGNKDYVPVRSEKWRMLSAWIYKQRRMMKSGKIHPYVKQRLESVGINWCPVRKRRQ